MTVGVLTTCHTHYTWDRSICIFYLIQQHSKFLLHTLQVLYLCTLCNSTNINTIIEFVPHVSGDGSVAVLIRTFSSGIHRHPVSWNCAYHIRMELSDGGCFLNLVRNCRWTIVPWQSFWITLYSRPSLNWIVAVIQFNACYITGLQITVWQIYWHRKFSPTVTFHS